MRCNCKKLLVLHTTQKQPLSPPRLYKTRLAYKTITQNADNLGNFTSFMKTCNIHFKITLKILLLLLLPLSLITHSSPRSPPGSGVSCLTDSSSRCLPWHPQTWLDSVWLGTLSHAANLRRETQVQSALMLNGIIFIRIFTILAHLHSLRI